MTETILAFIASHGYVAVFVLMVLENIFPPIPSEIILPFIGYMVAEGTLQFIPALLVSVAGAFFGTAFWFLIGRFVPAARLENFFLRYGGYVAIELRDFKAAVKLFHTYEAVMVFVGRMMPGVRSVISIPAGFVHMKVRTFITLSLLGIFIWNTLLMLAGYFVLDSFSSIEEHMAPVGDGIMALFLLAYVFQVIRFIRRRHTSARD